MAPNPITCSKDGCDFTTPVGIPNWELLLKALELHTAASHPQQVGHAAPNQGNGSSKLEKLPRTTFSLQMSEAQWDFTILKWDLILIRLWSLRNRVSTNSVLLAMKTSYNESMMQDSS